MSAVRSSSSAVAALTALTALGVAAAFFLLPGAGQTAEAQVDEGWVINSFDVSIDVGADGRLHVVEDIAVDFGALRKHGIFRDIPVRYQLAPDTDLAVPEGRQPDEYVRAIDIDDISVSSTAPEDVELSRPGPVGGHTLRIRIGDPDETVDGPQTYRIAYTVAGALNSFSTHEELYWNATGDGWGVPIKRASAVVSGPGMTQSTCFRGAFGASSLCDSSVSAAEARFAAEDLAPGEGLTVVVGFPPGSVEVVDPLLIERWTPSAALMGSPAAVPLAALVGLGVAAALGWLAYRQGRDRVTRGPISVDGHVEGDGPRSEMRRPLLAPRAVPVQFRPPQDLRPAQLGLVIDERVDPVDVSATIVDLAVRGHLVIEETQTKTLWISRSDWRLTRKENAEDQLLGYESKLLNALFEDGDAVDLSDLKGKFASDYQAVKSLIYNDAVSRRWFTRRPDHTRSLWLGLGIGAALASIALFVAAMLFTRVALAIIPLTIGGLALAIAHRWMPHRTGRGSRLLTETLGFKEFIVTAESGRLGYAEDANLFVQYLPYAVVFGAVDKWARAFAHLGAAAAAGVGTWYVGPHLGGAGLDLSRLSGGLSDFSSKVGGTLPTTPASSGSSGFSGGGGGGGGFGGGGGGSW